MSHGAIQKIKVASFFWNTVYKTVYTYIHGVVSVISCVEVRTAIELSYATSTCRGDTSNLSGATVLYIPVIISASLSIGIASGALMVQNIRLPHLSVRKSVLWQTADWIRMPFGMVSGVGAGIHVLDGTSKST